MAKREKIPINLSDKLLFECNRTCCICETLGKDLQIHHIDQNSSNNHSQNLIVLCLGCHSEVHTKKMLGKNWTPGQLLRCKKEWVKRVKVRKMEADKIASLRSVTGEGGNSNGLDDLEYKTSDSLHLLKIYLEKLPKIQKGQLLIASAEWDHPSPVGMVFGYGKMIDFYETVLIELSAFYTKGHFEQKNPKIYFGEQVSMRTSFAINKLQPFGPHIGYKLDRDIALDSLTFEIKNLVAELVEQLMMNSFDFDLGNYDVWIKQWNKK